MTGDETVCIKCGKTKQMKNYDICVFCYLELKQPEFEAYRQRLIEQKRAALLTQMAAKQKLTT